MRNKKRIQWVRHATYDKGGQQQHAKVMPQQHADDRPDTPNDGGDNDQKTTVHPVRNPTDRILQNHRTHKKRRNEDRNLRHGQPGFGTVNRGHAELRRKDPAQKEHADTPQGREAGQFAQAHRFGGVKRGRRADRQQNWRHRHADQNRRNNEQDKA